MTDFFIELLNISITASYLILAVILIRLIFKKIPKKFICLLWGIAAIRLVFPFSIESALSLIPSAQTIPENIAMQTVPAISSGIEFVNSTVNPVIADVFTPNPGDSVNPLQIITAVGSYIWIIGLAVMVLYGIISYLRVKRSVKTAVLLENNVWQSESVVSPFILGIVRPKIYIPFNMDNETKSYVISHENAHLRRRDHWIKPLGFAVLAVYWFNPLVWIAYILLCRDIEAACDEKVVASMDGDMRKEYARALLDCAVNRRRIAACPLAFGEVSVKNRIKNVMNYKKPAFWVIILAIAACIVAAVCFLTNPETKEYHDVGNRLKITVYSDGEAKETKVVHAQIGNKVVLLNGAEIEITLVDLQRDEMEVEFSGAPLYGEDRSVPAKGLLLTLYSSHNHTTDSGETVVIEYIKTQSLDDAISAAIMEHNSERYLKGTYACCYHEVLATEASGDASDNEIEKITAYIIAAYGEYEMKNGVVESVSGGSGPIALTFAVGETEYTLLDYWEAEDGSNYVSSIRAKFPKGVAESVIKDPYTVSTLCDRKAETYFRNNTQAGEMHSVEVKCFSTSDKVDVYADSIILGGENTGLRLQMTNNSSETVMTGRPYWVYRYENGEWVSCGVKETEYTWTLEGILILPGQTRELSCMLSLFDISKNGYYRLTKDFSLDGENHTASVEFFIDTDDEWEKLEFPPGVNMVVPESLYSVYENRVSSKRGESWFEFEKMANNGFVEYDETVEPVDGVIIKSKADFDEFIKEMSAHFEFYNEEKDVDFADTAKLFDDAFFKDNSLIIMHVRESSYSITHSLGNITRHHQLAAEDSGREDNGYALSFQVHREIPHEDADAESERFITLAMDNAAIGDVHSAYIVYGEDMRKPKAVYSYMENDEKPLVGAKVILYSDTEIMFSYSLLSSYIPHGTYTVNHGKLVMKTDDGRYTYTFNFSGDNLIFDAAHSSELPEYNYGDGTKFKPVPDGAVFEIQRS
ncbi:MAG: hypothetical protein IJD78_08720 [Clostridia bacterium]|nr:hypothetical protein [Clostridia bacterium]